MEHRVQCLKSSFALLERITAKLQRTGIPKQQVASEIVTVMMLNIAQALRKAALEADDIVQFEKQWMFLLESAATEVYCLLGPAAQPVQVTTFAEEYLTALWHICDARKKGTISGDKKTHCT